MIELLRQHALRTGKSYQEMLAIYRQLKEKAKSNHYTGQREMEFLNKELEAIPDKPAIPIKEIAVESKEDSDNSRNSKAKSKGK